MTTISAFARTLVRDLTNVASVAVSASRSTRAGAGERAARHDAEVDDHRLQQLLDRLRRFDDQRLHSAAIEAGGLGAAPGDAASASAAG